MAKDKKRRLPAIIQHGWHVLPHVTVDAYNEELKDKDGFLGDHASKGAFRDILDKWRREVAEHGEDPFGDTPTDELTKSQLDDYLKGEDAFAAGLIHTAVEEFAGELAAVAQRFLVLEEWKDTQHIVVGGGLSGSHIGKLAIGRALVLLKNDGIKIGMSPIANHPDEAGLLGGLELAPSWILDGHDAIVAADIGGTNLRVGIVELKMKKGDIAKAGVWKSSLWRHKDDEPTRDDTVTRMAEMIEKLVDKAHEEKLRVAPFIAVGCPGLITRDGTIEKGAQNLPGNWEEKDFSLSAELADKLPLINGHEPLFVIHNDAVVQGLSETANMQDVDHWGVFTIGTGLGNARFTNRK
jgi:predicted NBD/HSP70 family sugar kinase